jgi:hypothetical protein
MRPLGPEVTVITGNSCRPKQGENVLEQLKALQLKLSVSRLADETKNVPQGLKAM